MSEQPQVPKPWACARVRWWDCAVMCSRDNLARSLDSKAGKEAPWSSAMVSRLFPISNLHRWDDLCAVTWLLWNYQARCTVFELLQNKHDYESSSFHQSTLVVDSTEQLCYAHLICKEHLKKSKLYSEPFSLKEKNYSRILTSTSLPGLEPGASGLEVQRAIPLRHRDCARISPLCQGLHTSHPLIPPLSASPQHQDQSEPTYWQCLVLTTRGRCCTAMRGGVRQASLCVSGNPDLVR